MASRPGHRARHRRRTGRRRAAAAGFAAFALTGAALMTSAMLSPAGAAGAWPTARGARAISSTIDVSGTFDGGLKRYYGSDGLGGDGQDEGRNPVFRLEDGAVLKNVVLDAPAAKGVQCQGSCTLQNVWWEDVGEDAATFGGTTSSAVYTVYGGGAQKASDTVFRFNGAGKLVVTRFQVADFGELVRSCGTCSTQAERSVVVNDVDVTAPGGAIVGIDSGRGDTAALHNVRIHGDTGKKIKPCVRFQDGDTGDEPAQIGTGADGTYCRYTAFDLTYG
ncbi:pectate lyase [Streptomyces sp. NPDC002577]